MRQFFLFIKIPKLNFRIIKNFFLIFEIKIKPTLNFNNIPHQLVDHQLEARKSLLELHLVDPRNQKQNCLMLAEQHLRLLLFEHSLNLIVELVCIIDIVDYYNHM